MPGGHEPRLMQQLRLLLQQQRVAMLATCTPDGLPHASMVPFAVEPTQGLLVLHVSQLAAHTRYMQQQPAVSLLIVQPEQAEEPVHALPRVSLDGEAHTPERTTDAWQQARAAYLARFPEVEPMLALEDFRFVTISPKQARHIAGFGAARNVDLDELAGILQSK